MREFEVIDNLLRGANLKISQRQRCEVRLHFHAAQRFRRKLPDFFQQ